MSEQSARGQFGIGEVLAQLRPEFPDISTSKIRFLEAEGLIEPARSRSGYRRFSAADIERLRYILTMQRDSYLPLRVIRERLADGTGGSEGADGQTQAGRAPADLTRRQLLDAAEISESELTELEDYGLIRRVGRLYGADALAVARALAALRQYGVQARHLRAVKAAADREANLVEQVVAPQLRQRGPGARDAAARTAWQIADLTRRQLLDAAEISESELTELEDYGLIRRVGRLYGADALAVARALAALRQYGVQARHLRAVKAAADREANLVEQVIAPQLRQRGPGARDAAARTAWQIADLTLRLHATLVESALGEAGLSSAPLHARVFEFEAHGQAGSGPAPDAAGPAAGGLRSASGRLRVYLGKGSGGQAEVPRHVRTEL